MQPLSAPVFQNVGAGLKAIIPAFDRGMTYVAILLKCAGTTFDTSHLGEIEIKANGKTIGNLTAGDIQKINNYYNETANAQYLLIPFGDVEARTIDGMLMGALDTSVLNSLSMSVQIDPAAVAPELEATILALPPKVKADGSNRPDRYVFRAFLDADHAPASAATHQLQLAMGNKGGNLVKAVHFMDDSGIISKVNVKRDGVDQQDNGEVATIQHIQNMRKRTVVAGHVAFDPTVFNNQSEALPTLRRDGTLAPWRFDVTTTAGGTVRSYTEAYVRLETI